jgi:hypothetical protein
MTEDPKAYRSLFHRKMQQERKKNNIDFSIQDILNQKKKKMFVVLPMAYTQFF